MWETIKSVAASITIFLKTFFQSKQTEAMARYTNARAKSDKRALARKKQYEEIARALLRDHPQPMHDPNVDSAD